MLPSRKRTPAASFSDVVYTGEIEVVSERGLPPPSRPIDRRPISYHPVSRPTPSEVRRLLPTPSEPHYVLPAPSSVRHATIVPPSAREPLAGFSDSDDDMTVLWAERSMSSGARAPSRRPAAWAAPPAPAPVPQPTYERPTGRFDYEARLAVTGPANRRSEEPPAPDSLRPVAMAASLPVDTSGRHELPPTSFTMRTQLLPGRPTLAWAGALVVIGALVGLGTSFLTQTGAGSAPSAARSTFDTTGVAAAAQPPASAPVAAPVVAENRAPEVAAAAAKPVTPPGEWVVAKAPSAAPSAGTSGPLAALTGAKGDGDSASPVPERPTYVAPATHAAPVRRWVAPPKAVAAAAPQATAPVAPPAAESFPSAPATPAAWKVTAKAAKSKRGADADLQAASASDALARAQLEAALR